MDEKARKAIQGAFNTRAPIYLSADGLDITFQTHIVQFADGDITLENVVRPEYITAFMTSKSFNLQCGMLRFSANRLKTDGIHLIFTVRADTVADETRQAERFPFTADEMVICELLNPVDGETHLSKTVLDMSALGISIQTTGEGKLFTAGRRLPTIKIMIDGKLYNQTSGEVVYRRKLMDPKGHLRMQVGIRFDAKA